MRAPLIFAAALASTPATAATVALKDTLPHITSAGFASAEVVPDQAELRLGVANERPTADAAAETTVKAAGDVVAAMKSQGVDPRDIKTTFNLTAQYEQQRDARGVTKQTLRGYLCEERITLRLHDVSKAGALARGFIEKGANEFQGIDFSYSKEEAKRDELKAQAIRNAVARAKIYTDAIGVRLGRVLQIGDEGVTGEADMPSRRAVPRMAVAVPTEPGVQRIEEAISVIWEIEGKAP